MSPHLPRAPRSLTGALDRHRAALLATLPGAVIAAVVAGAALAPPHALRGVHGFTGRGYDDGVYLGSAVRLLHGVLPWRDVDVLHPPGGTLLLLPAAVLGEVTDTQTGLAAARLAMVVLAAVTAVVAGLAVRHHGALASGTAALVLASFPGATSATHTPMLEPPLTCACLVALCLAFRDGAVASPRRLGWAGVALGVAGSIKIWAALPAVVLLLVLVVATRGRDRRAGAAKYAAGVAAGFLVPTLPLAIWSPGTFLHDVVAAQLGRQAELVPQTWAQRWPILLGLEQYPVDGPRTAATVLTVVLTVWLVAGLACGLRARRAGPLEATTLLGLAGLVLALSRPPQLYDHYAYVVAGFAAVALGSATGLLRAALAGTTARRMGPPVSIALLLAAVAVAPGNLDRAREYVADSVNPGPTIRQAVPRGSCVVTDMPTLLLIADRLPRGRDCEAPLDPFGLWLVEDGRSPGSPPPYDPDFTADWQRWLDGADHVVLSVDLSSYVPWDDALLATLATDFERTVAEPRLVVYRRLR